eukprot:scaffold59749_cov73-Phaeocystis_antarctica.AAC.7
MSTTLGATRRLAARLKHQLTAAQHSPPTSAGYAAVRRHRARASQPTHAHARIAREFPMPSDLATVVAVRGAKEPDDRCIA